MKNVRNIALAVTITFMVNVALNLGVNYFTQDNGTITVGPSSPIQGKTYLPVTISNFSSNSLDDIVVSVPSSIIPTELIASDPIRVSDELNNAGTSDRKQISISSIGHNRVVTLQIPLANQGQVPLVEVINARQKKLTVLPVKDISFPLTRMLLSALFLSGIVALFYALLMIWAHTRFIELEKQSQELHNQIEKTNQEIAERMKKVEKRDAEASAMMSRVKILLFARMHDYSRELQFWRDTMRKVLYGLTGGTEAGEEIVKLVTESLKTYGTRGGSAHDFETINVLAKLIFKSEAIGDK